MKNVKNKKMMAVVLPEGCFYGNCSDCVYADRSDWRDGEVYCHSEDLTNIARNRDLNTVLEAVNDLYPQTEHSNAPEQEPMGGMTLG